MLHNKLCSGSLIALSIVNGEREGKHIVKCIQGRMCSI